MIQAYRPTFHMLKDLLTHLAQIAQHSEQHNGARPAHASQDDIQRLRSALGHVVVMLADDSKGDDGSSQETALRKGPEDARVAAACVDGAAIGDRRALYV